MKKILALTSIRADYDLMSGLYALLHRASEVDFRLLVGGAHLSRSFGHTVDLIRKDGFPILAKIECLIDGDSPRSRLKTAAVFLQSACDAVAQWSPDLMIVAGDREDALMGSIMATYLHIPLVHFFGGDHEQDGHADTAARHAISKLATAHVVATQEHRERLRAMGESDERIFVAGSVALDRFVAHRPLNADELRGLFPVGKVMDGYALLIFHPVDAERDLAGRQFEMILQELRARGIPVCASFPNTDPGNHLVRAAMARHQNEPDCWFFTNLERTQFLSVYKGARFIIGNSSSGILEAASIPMPAINVGLRQRGRAAGANVVFCDADPQSIQEAVSRVEAPTFRAAMTHMHNPYGMGRSCELALKYILDHDFSRLQAKVEDPLRLSLPQGIL